MQGILVTSHLVTKKVMPPASSITFLYFSIFTPAFFNALKV